MRQQGAITGGLRFYFSPCIEARHPVVRAGSPATKVPWRSSTAAIGSPVQKVTFLMWRLRKQRWKSSTRECHLAYSLLELLSRDTDRQRQKHVY